MSKKAQRRDQRIAAAKKRDTELFARGAADAGAIAELEKLDGAALGKLLVSTKLDRSGPRACDCPASGPRVRPMSATRAVSLRVLGAAHALVTARQAARAPRTAAETAG